MTVLRAVPAQRPGLAEVPAPVGATAPRDSRTLVFSQRHAVRWPWHGTQYELEDLLVEVDDVTLVAPPAQDHPHLRRISRGLDHRVRARAGLARRSPVPGEPGIVGAPVTTDHDLFFAVFHFADQLSYLHRLPGWRERSGLAACLLVELWTPWVGRDADYLELLRQFDVVYVNNSSVVPALRAAGVPQARYLPMAVDAERLSPLPRVPDRVVDVYSYGRRSEAVHRGLMDLVDRDGLTYVYDSLAESRLRDHREHRLLLANLLKRSRYVLAHRINDSPDRLATTGGEEALSTRYFEASAAGAVVLGSRPRTPDFDQAFPWPDAVVDLPYDSDDVAALLAELDAQPDRLAEARAQGVVHGLREHDWSARWQTVLRDLGLPALPALDARVARLRSLADRVDPELPLGRADRRTAG